jgi:hypothetical protein
MMTRSLNPKSVLIKTKMQNTLKIKSQTMNKLKFLPIAIISVLLFGCKANTTTSNTASGLHEVKVEEVIQATKYTYLRVKENSIEQWLAVPSIQANAGETWYYASGFEMKNFESKDLKRTFESVLFIDKIDKDPSGFTKPAENTTATSIPSTLDAPGEGNKGAIAEGSISIADLYAKRKDYNGKIVTVKGKVTKANSGILGKNWFHIVDGTKFEKFNDLSVNSDAFVNLGDEVVFQGRITLDKDLGSGYFFPVLMEDAILK